MVQIPAIALSLPIMFGSYFLAIGANATPTNVPLKMSGAHGAPISPTLSINSQEAQNLQANSTPEVNTTPLLPPSFGSAIQKVDPPNSGDKGSAKILLPDLNGEGENSGLQDKKPQEDAWHKLHASSSRSPLDASNPGAVSDNLNKLFGAKDTSPQNNAPAVQLGNEAVGANVTPTSTNINFESSNSLGRVGVDYLAPGSVYGFGIKVDGSHLFGKTIAGGTNLRLNKNLKEVGLNISWMPKDWNLKTKLSASYMVGRQDFNFYSGTATSNLSQIGHYLSMQYVVPKKDSDYLHSIGLSTWSSSAKQTNNPDPVYGVTDTTSYIELTKDTRKLAVGTLRGSAADIQMGFTNQLIAKVSAGYEGIKYPYSDGSQEINRRIYQDYIVQFSPTPELALQAGYKMGAALNNMMVSAAYRRWQITGYKNQGINGIAGNQGLTVSYSIPLDGKEKFAPIGALTRPELVGDGKYILRDAIERPVQLPQTFIAKVDPTAVKSLIRINKQDLPQMAKFNSEGDIEVSISVAAGAATSIQSVVKNEVVDSAAGNFARVSGGTFTIRMRDIPVPVRDKDVYQFDVSGSTGERYRIKFSVLRT